MKAIFCTLILFCSVVSLAQVDTTKFPNVQPHDVTILPTVFDGMVIVYPGEQPNFEYEEITELKIKFVKSWRMDRINFMMMEKAWAHMTKTDRWANCLIYSQDDLLKAKLVKIKSRQESEVLSSNH